MATYYNVYSGITKYDLAVNDYDERIYVSKGGTAIFSEVSGGGTMTVFVGGKATSTTVYDKSILYVDWGATASYTSIKGGEMDVRSAGMTVSSFVQNNGSVYVYKKGIASDTFLSNTVGKMYVSGGTAVHAVVYSNSLIDLESGGIASRTCLFGGQMTVYDGCKAVDTEIDRRGSAIVSSGGSIRNTHISAYKGSGGELHVRYDGKATGTTVDFYGKMVVSNGGVADKTYLNGSMFVNPGGLASRTTVSGGSMIVSNGGSAAKTAVSGGSMIVSNGGMAYGTTVASEGSMFVSVGGSATKTTVNGGYMAVSDGGRANGVTVKKWDAMVVFFKGASASNVVVSGGEVFISSGATVTGLTNKGADVRVAKGAIVSNCKGNPLYFADADGGWNEYEKGEIPAAYHNIEVEKIPTSTKKIALDSDGTVSMNGMINFVGNDDRYDYAKIKLDHAANLSFRIEATGAVKFTIWKWTGSKMVSLQSTTLKKNAKTGLYAASTKKYLLEKDGEYYISVQALNVKTGGFAYYNVFLNTDNCTFYKRVDNNNNDWMVDSGKNLNVSADVSSLSLGLTSKQLQVDKTSVNYGSWNNFVGYSDATDYAKVSVTQDLKASFTVEATDASKFTVCQIVSKGEGGYSLKSIRTKTLAKQKDGTYKVTLTGISLKKGNDYCICMKSTNAKKGGNAYYNVSYSAVLQASAALSGPEEDANDRNIVMEAANASSLPDALADSGLVSITGADLADMRMSDSVDPAVSPIPVPASDDLFAGLLFAGDAIADVSALAESEARQADSLLLQQTAALA